MITNEIWKPVVGVTGYEVSNVGNVRSIDRVVRYSTGSEVAYRGRMLNKRTEKKGNRYWVVTITKGKSQYVHRVVAKAFIPNPQNKSQVNHINGIKTDNRVENLEWVTPRENTTHAIQIGRVTQRGAGNPRALLQERDVKQIRRYLSGGKSVRSVADMYKMAWTTIYQIKNRTRWSYLKN